MKAFFFLIVALVVTVPALGTIDYMRVNHITKEYQWCEDDCGLGWIGWENLPEVTPYPFREDHFQNLGYQKTNFAFKIEVIVLLLIIIPLSGLFIWLRRTR